MRGLALIVAALTLVVGAAARAETPPNPPPDAPAETRAAEAEPALVTPKTEPDPELLEHLELLEDLELLEEYELVEVLPLVDDRTEIP